MKLSEAIAKIEQLNAHRYQRLRTHEELHTSLQEAAQILKELCNEIIDSGNFNLGFRTMEAYYAHGIPNPAAFTPEDRDMEDSISTIDHYLREYCFRAPNIDGYVSNWCLINEAEEIIFRYNPKTGQPDAIAPYYYDKDGNIIDTETGKLIYLYIEHKNEYLKIGGPEEPDKNIPIPEPEQNLHFNGLLAAKQYRTIFQNLTKAKFLHPESDLDT